MLPDEQVSVPDWDDDSIKITPGDEENGDLIIRIEELDERPEVVTPPLESHPGRGTFTGGAKENQEIFRYQKGGSADVTFHDRVF